MTLTDLPRMLFSETEGWRDIQRMHPGVTKMLLAVVGPLSLLPPLMYAYANMAHPGAIFPRLEPALSTNEALLVGGIFFLVEVAMVFMMADLIRQFANAKSLQPDYAQCFALAAIAPVPLWLTSVMLFIPSLWFNVIMLAAAWIGTAALIRHGVRSLLEVDDGELAHRIGNRITFAGVIAWLALMIMMALVVSIMLGWR
ncbi:YIP1 family protein [Nitrogeniibacter mangrovi]|uniref:YIP1 family protein n=1 Tax=Nitrogeniibacter mangrovi TaxID=2016596 RepID=A0A6C1B0D7_9RHOO|nr:Yip1 family protein [Nitrogeniibacter mangrovi]QID16278.1 YIP1 family protein [Nitrogeniibacter mangrovi]